MPSMQYNSIYIGYVIDNRDPEDRGRCRLVVPQLFPIHTSKSVKHKKDSNAGKQGVEVINSKDDKIDADEVNHSQSISIEEIVKEGNYEESKTYWVDLSAH